MSLNRESLSASVSILFAMSVPGSMWTKLEDLTATL